MAPTVLVGDTLGKKHHYYNKLVKEALSNKLTVEPLSEEDDIQNLIRIDIACETKDVAFVLEALKSEDLLYVSRAIKNSKWLITEKEYADIVNVEYLHTKLKPCMTSKAFNKLMLSIRLNLREEVRAEAFYDYIADRNQKDAYKWLPLCSVAFIENVVKKRDAVADIPSYIFLRLFEKSISIFAIYAKTGHYYSYELMKKTIFLASIDPEKYLDVLESIPHRSVMPWTPKTTSNFMKRCPNRILDKFESYARDLHLPTFVKYLKEKDDIKKFLLKHVQDKKLKWLFSYNYIHHFLKQMPKEGKFEFVKKIFIDKELPESIEPLEDFPSSPIMYCAQKCRSLDTNNENSYHWYKFAPFDTAFTDLKKLIRAESSPSVRILMLQVMLSCAGHNMKNVQTVLKYYQQKHINEPFKFKIQFVNTFISRIDTHEFDDQTWSSLNQLFQSMETYVESENDVQSCIKSIIIRHVIRKEKVPDIINSKFIFDTLKHFNNRLKKQEDKDVVFTYLYKYIVAKNENHKITTQAELNDAVGLCENLMNLLNDWSKKLHKYPYVLKKVKDLITIKEENCWNTVAMTSIYNINKSWKKELFEESIVLCPSEGVCLNALKHDPGLLTRHRREVEVILKNDGILPTGFLRKARIYWSDSLAEELKNIYLNRLEKADGRKALVIGLCTLLSQKEMCNVAKKYAPTESKIDWNEIDEFLISLQKQISKNMSKARPLIPLEIVLLYAKGDYLQFAVPSLSSVLSQLSANKVRQHIPTLLNAPVSLQKFGVRCAFDKLSSQELKPMLTEIWNSTKNSSIRTVLFTHTYALLCKEKNTNHINAIWELLRMIIDNLSAEENKIIYQKLGEVSEVPLIVRAQFFMKSFTFLKSLPAKANCEPIINDLSYKSPDVMEYLDDDFVINVMLKDVDRKISSKSYDNSYELGIVIPSFILSCKNKETESRRCELLINRLLDRFLPKSFTGHDEKQYCIKNNLKEVLKKVVFYMDEYNILKKMNLPVKTFTIIQSKLSDALSYQKDYVYLTSWKLAREFIKLLEEHKDTLSKLYVEEINESQFSQEKAAIYSELHKKIAPHFAKICVQILKNDVKSFPSSVYSLFSQSLNDFLTTFLGYSFIQPTDVLHYYKCILECSTDREVYLAIFPLLPRYVGNPDTEKDKETVREVRKMLFSHPSDEIKMHYYQLFSENPDLDIEK